MLASIMQALDNTIANVALPRMQGSLSATQDQMTWVLTSYIVAAAIMTPLTGWLAESLRPQAAVPGLDRRLHRRLGAVRSRRSRCRRSCCSACCRASCGAALMPLSQAVLFDIYPPQQHGRAMAIWGIGVDARSDPRSDARRLADRRTTAGAGCSIINVPFGILAVLGCWRISPTPRTSASASISSASRR